MRSEGKIGSLSISTFFVFAGVVTLWDTQKYTDSDSQVFPQAVAIVLIICATLTLIVTLLRGGDGGGFGNGIWWRRALLVVSLLVACFLMPYLGFLLSGSVAFFGGLIAAMHDKWSAKAGVIYSLSGIAIMSGFFSLFKFVLLVPLP